MNSVDWQDKKDMIIKYGKYALILIVLIIVIISLKGCKQSYSSIENDMIAATKSYIAENNIVIQDQQFIEISKLSAIEGTELCSKASGVLVKNNNGAISYTPYLKCEGYETKQSTKKYKYIILNGDDIIVLNRGEVYQEPAYTLTGDADVTISGTVGSAPGVYQIRYDVYVDNHLEETAYRTVIVVLSDKNQNVTGLKNKEEPTLTLKGDTDIVLKVNEKYHEPGYTAVDYTDGKITRQVIIEPDPSKISTKTPTVYDIVYSVTNSKGNMAIARRKVTVVKYKADLEITLTKSTESLAKTVDIGIYVKGDGFSSIEYPVYTVNRTATYTARNNGPYKFTVVDSYGNRIIKEIEIDNIDNVAPTGKCSATVIGSNTEVQVEALDDKGISGYSYILDSGATEYMTSATYKVATATKNASVKVKDVAGNETVFNCEVTIKEETTTSGRPSGSTEVIDTSEYRLVVTKNDTVEFAKLVDSLNVAQNHPPKYPDYCLSFAYYHAYMLYNGNNLSSMNAPDGASYMYASKFQGFKNDSKQVVLEKIYEEINNGHPLVLHVNGNKAGTSRHYVTVVGYKNSVTSGSTMTEEDILIIDSYDGKLERMDREGSRFMITGYDTGRKGDKGYGYQLYILK